MLLVSPHNYQGETVLTVTNRKTGTDKYYVSLEISYIQLEQFRPLMGFRVRYDILRC